VLLTSCQIEPRFQDARDVTHVSVAVTVSLGLNSLPPLFLAVSEVTLKDAELHQLQDEFHIFRTRRGHMMTPTMVFYP
jgi:hypothetical protein